MLVIITIGINIVLLYLCKIIWYTYMATPIGKQYMVFFAGRSQAVTYILSNNLVIFSIRLTLSAFTTCLLVGAVCQVLHITRYLYMSRGFFGRIVFWGLPLTAVAAYCAQFAFEIEFWPTAVILFFVPTLCVFTGCFKYTTELLPEIEDVIQKAAGNVFVRQHFSKLKKQIKNLAKKINESE